MADEAFQFIEDFRLADAPASVVRKARWCLIGVAAAGSRLSASRITRAVARSRS